MVQEHVQILALLSHMGCGRFQRGLSYCSGYIAVHAACLAFVLPSARQSCLPIRCPIITPGLWGEIIDTEEVNDPECAGEPTLMHKLQYISDTPTLYSSPIRLVGTIMLSIVHSRVDPPILHPSTGISLMIRVAAIIAIRCRPSTGVHSTPTAIVSIVKAAECRGGRRRG